MLLPRIARALSWILMARFVTHFLVALALALPAAAQQEAKCGAPQSIDDGWAIAAPDAAVRD
jgi:hypothetical protein